jgi:glutamine synthetase
MPLWQIIEETGINQFEIITDTSNNIINFCECINEVKIYLKSKPYILFTTSPFLKDAFNSIHINLSFYDEKYNNLTNSEKSKDKVVH